MISESSIPGTVWTTKMSISTAEKFAELIVRECLDIVDEEGCGEGGSVSAIKSIKEHFGVEK